MKKKIRGMGRKRQKYEERHIIGIIEMEGAMRGNKKYLVGYKAGFYLKQGFLWLTSIVIKFKPNFSCTG